MKLTRNVYNVVLIRHANSILKKKARNVVYNVVNVLKMSVLLIHERKVFGILCMGIAL